MAYLTAEQLEARVGGADIYRELTDDNGDGTPDAEVIAALLAGVDEEANGYFLAGGYGVPLDALVVKPVINALLDIANYRAKTRGDRQASTDDRLLYDGALGLLQRVADHTLLLDAIVDVLPVSGYYAVDAETEIFSRSKLRSF